MYYLGRKKKKLIKSYTSQIFSADVCVVYWLLAWKVELVCGVQIPTEAEFEKNLNFLHKYFRGKP